MAGKGIPELLNYKQKGKDLNEFIKVPVSEKLAYCFGDPALTLMYTMTTTLLIYFYTNVVGISAGAVGKIIYAFVTYNIMNTVVYTAISQPFHALGSLMSRDRRERDVICAGCVLGVAGQLLFLINITSVPLGVATCIMRGIGIAPFYGVQYSLPSDAIEYGQWKTGKRVEGLMFSSMSMGQKAGSGLTSAIMGGILSAAYFDGTKATAAQLT